MSLFNETMKNLFKTPIDFMSFNLISKLPYQRHYNELTFIPTVRINNDNKTDYKGNYMNKNIKCADDIVYHATQVLDPDLKAWGLQSRLKSAMMQSATNLETANAKYIVFTDMVYEKKTGNSIIATFTNNSSTANKNIVIEYRLYNTL
jgi:hypothetical protein